MSVFSGMRLGCSKAVWSFWVLCCKPLLLWFPWTISSVLSTQVMSWALPTSCPFPSSYWPHTLTWTLSYRTHYMFFLLEIIVLHWWLLWSWQLPASLSVQRQKVSVLLYLFEISLHVCIQAPMRTNKGLFSGLPLWLHIITQFLFSFSLTFCFLENREWLLSLGF